MYKQASRLGLRVSTESGMLSIEQLWTLSIPKLDNLAVALEEEYKNSGKKSFVVKRSVKDKELKLKFDIVLDILNTKVDEAAALSEAKDKKAEEQELLGLLAEIEKDEMKNLSKSEIKAKLAKLRK